MPGSDDRPVRPEDPPRWRCAAGTVVGRRDGDLVRATGIRYARAERYGLPVAEPPATEPVMATSFSPACPQAPAPVMDDLVRSTRDLGVDEHCQRLSVTAPADAAPGDDLPVMVWLHGGSYVSGAGDAAAYDPASLVREQRVVVVTVTYRLGLLGYLGGDDGRPGNLGLLDQIEALRWVRRCIGAFGGDPGCVTVFGESAGGDAAAHLMVADGAEGLLHRAVVQSAPLGIARGRERMARAMAAATAALPTTAEPEDLLRVQQRLLRRALRHGLVAAMPFGLQYGRHPLPAEADVDRAWQEAATRVDLMVGRTSREVALFVLAVPPLARALRSRVGGPLVERALVAPLTDRIYGTAAEELAGRHRRAGGRGCTYLLCWGAPGNAYRGSHGIELPLLLGSREVWEGPVTAGATWEDVDAQGRVLRRLWAGFAREGTLATQSHPGLVEVTELLPTAT